MNKVVLRGIGIVSLVVLTIAITLIALWLRPYPPAEPAREALRSTNAVMVNESSSQISFIPQGEVSKGFIFYPGALVAPEAYALKMHQIASQGFAVFIVKMPLNLAVLGANYADQIIAEHPEIAIWAVGGHSLGGAMACRYAVSAQKVHAAIFYAAYCDANFSLAGRVDVQVTSIYGTKDALATIDKIEQTKQYAPLNAVYVAIVGGNHAQFGDYGSQAGDGIADISNTAATRQIVDATVQALLEVQP